MLHVVWKNMRLNTKLGPHICLCIMAAVAVIVSGDKTFADRDTLDEPLLDREDFKKVWELYILPRLEYELRNRLIKLEEINQPNFDEYERYPDLDGEFCEDAKLYFYLIYRGCKFFKL